MRLKRPKTSKAEVLHRLIKNKEVSIMDFPYLSGFRTRISEFYIEHGIFIQKERIVAKNKYNNYYTYTLHKLPDNQLSKAITVYKNINK